jgi:hypothetical protein
VISAAAIGLGVSAWGSASATPHDEQNLLVATFGVSHAAQMTGGTTGAAGFGSSCTAVLNSRTDLPTAPLTFVRRPAPKMITRITRTIKTSHGPKPISPTSYAYAVSRSIGFRDSRVKFSDSDLHHQLDFDGEACWQLVDADSGTRVPSGVAENFDEQIGGSIGDRWLLVEPARAVDEGANPHQLLDGI